jgi:hypothetical protein
VGPAGDMDSERDCVRFSCSISRRVQKCSDQVVDEAVGPSRCCGRHVDSHRHCLREGNVVGEKRQGRCLGLVWASECFVVGGAHSGQSGISFERSVTISEKEHQVGGLGDPPNVKRNAMQAVPAKMMID